MNSNQQVFNPNCLNFQNSNQNLSNNQQENQICIENLNDHFKTQNNNNQVQSLLEISELAEYLFVLASKRITNQILLIKLQSWQLHKNRKIYNKSYQILKILSELLTQEFTEN